MSRVVAGRALLILSIALPSAACGTFSTREVPVVTKVKPGAGLLQLCEEPMRPDLSKDLNANGEAFADLAQKFRDCSARHAQLVGWFDER